MTIPAGMLTEVVTFVNNAQTVRTTRRAALNTTTQAADLPEFREFRFSVTVRYDSYTRAVKPKDFIEWQGGRYTIEEVQIRKHERLVDVIAGSRK